MAVDRRRGLLFGALALVAAGLVYRSWPGASDARAVPPRQPARPATAGRAAPGMKAPEVHLGALEAQRPQPVTGDRDLFRFKSKAPPPPAAPVRVDRRPDLTPGPLDPPPAPQLPPITFKFIGIVETGDRSAKIAVLSDGRSVLQGREGDIIEGRYRILRIGVESIEMAYLDGRGRQTIRLTGS